MRGNLAARLFFFTLPLLPRPLRTSLFADEIDQIDEIDETDQRAAPRPSALVDQHQAIQILRFRFLFQGLDKKSIVPCRLKYIDPA